MQVLELLVDGRSVLLEPGPRLERENVLVPVGAFSAVVGAEAKLLDGSDQLAVCLADLCVPILEDISIEGERFTALADLAEALGLSWEVEGSILRVSTAGEKGAGLGIGMSPPAFELPDLHTGEPVSLHDYKGKKAVFYLWASW